jgi:hypothetical protein
VQKILDAPWRAASWMPEMETEEAPACQRTDLPFVNSPMRKRAWVAVIHVYFSKLDISLT